MMKKSICACCEKAFNWNDENSCWKCGLITCPNCTYEAECQFCHDAGDDENYSQSTDEKIDDIISRLQTLTEENDKLKIEIAELKDKFNN